jgi:glucose-6-phosphate isomerase
MHFYTQDIEGIEFSIKNWKAKKTFSHLSELRLSLPLFKELEDDSFIDGLDSVVERYRAFDDVVILGTGGSSLGGQAVLALEQHPGIHFIDNIDPYTFSNLLAKLDPNKTGFIAISKSGGTAETLVQLLTCLQWFNATANKISDHFLAISEVGNNALRHIAETYSIPCLDHPLGIGGRYAAFTIVGMLPALIAGLDARALRQGARDVLAQLDSENLAESFPPIVGAVIAAELNSKGYNQSILMPYIDRLQTFSSWYCQLWAESLGKATKEGKAFGITPVRALGAVDQHSQLQLYLDGPRDKIMTLIVLEQQTSLEKLSISSLTHHALQDFIGTTMGDLLLAEQKATIDVLRSRGCPTRVIRLSCLNESVLGALMMHFILETLVTAHLVGVDPFDQPAVEQGKLLAMEYLVRGK